MYPWERRFLKYALVAMDVASDFLFISLMRDKSTESVVEALSELRAYVPKTKPGVSVSVFMGDSDTAWAVTGLGDTLCHTRTTEGVAKWLSALPEEEEAGFEFSEPYAHQHLAVERGMWLCVPS